MVLSAAVAALALAAPPQAAADLADEEALAAKHAPVVRLVAQAQQCGYGETYGPIDVELLFGEPTVALRGPGAPATRGRRARPQEDVGAFRVPPRLPGQRPGARGATTSAGQTASRAGSTPAVYAHVATDPAHPGKLALQYWLFYTFNDFNNTHEGDWEMIQLVLRRG